MPIFSGLIFLGLFGLFCVSIVGLVRFSKKRRYLLAVPSAILTLVLGAYFTDIIVGPFQFSTPESNFKYALGFYPPSGVTNLATWKEEGFNPGVTIYLHFVAGSNALAAILASGHFSSSGSDEFQNIQKHPKRPDWWQSSSSRLDSFWVSDKFAGPYAYHSAHIAYEVSSGVTWIYVDAFE